jgi:hypothetical protein
MLRDWLEAKTSGGVWKDATSKAQHFAEHSARGECFGAVDADDYEARAVGFLYRKKRRGVLSCRRFRKNGCLGDWLRYDPVTQEFGVLMTNGRVRSYYLPRLKSVAYPKGHMCKDNEEYFRQQCKRKF